MKHARTSFVIFCTTLAALTALTALPSGIPDAAAEAKAAGNKDQAALARLEATYQPTAKLAGAERTKQACADATKLQTAAEAAIPEGRVPSGAVVDNTTWLVLASRLMSKVEDLGSICKTPERKRMRFGKKLETADEIVTALDGYMRVALNASKPRDVPPAMKTFQTTFDGMRASSKQLCAQHKKLVALLPDLGKPPAKADTAMWQQVHAQLKASVEEVNKFGCGAKRGADEEIAGALSQVHDRYYDLVVLVPPRA